MNCMLSVEKTWKSMWENCEKVLHSFKNSDDFSKVFHSVQKFSMGFSTNFCEHFSLLLWRFYTFST